MRDNEGTQDKLNKERDVLFGRFTEVYGGDDATAEAGLPAHTDPVEDIEPAADSDPAAAADSIADADAAAVSDLTAAAGPHAADDASDASGALGADASDGTTDPERADDPEGPKTCDLEDATIKVPSLREKRDRKAKGGKRNLIPDAKPQILDAQGKVLEDVREHRDFELAYLPDDDGQPDWSEGALDEITDAGSYWVVARGMSDALSGITQQRFEVGKPRRRWPWALLAALLAVIAIGVALYFAGFTPWYDPNAGEGLAGLEGEDLQAYLDAKVEEGSMNITVVTPLVFTQGTTNEAAPGKIAFNNLAANHVDQRLRITLDDSGDLVCETGAISPGQNIEYVTLNRELDPGVYEATATVTGYDRETHDEKGSLAAKIQIIVKDQVEE